MQAAFGVALQQALDLGVDRIERRLGLLASLVRKGLAAVPGVTVRDHGRRLCAICSFTKVCQGSQRVCFPSAKMHLQCLERRGKLRPACSYGCSHELFACWSDGPKHCQVHQVESRLQCDELCAAG